MFGCLESYATADGLLDHSLDLQLMIFTMSRHLHDVMRDPDQEAENRQEAGVEPPLETEELQEIRVLLLAE